MKKKYAWMAAALVINLLWLSGCGSGSTTTPTSTSGNTGSAQQQLAGADKISPVKVTLAGGSVGGSWSAIGEAIGEAIRQVAPGSSFGYQPGQDGANAITVATGQTELGFVFSVMAKAAYEGNPPYKQKLPDLRAIGTFGPLIYQTIATEKSGIKTYADMKNRPVILCVNTKDSTQETLSKALLQEHGITYADIEKNGGKILYLSSSAALDLMKNGRADARIGMEIAPEAKLAEAATTTKMIMVQPDAVAIKNIISKFPVLPVTIKANTYNFQRADLSTFEVPVTLVAGKNLPDNVAYAVTKGLVEQLDYLKTVVPSQMSKDTPESIAKTSIPLHPGAEKYYKEKGLLK
ncbi:TAXI family TRAP transporter solute-binding subunit [Paradesulfitobacterium aromaticivorans]